MNYQKLIETEMGGIYGGALLQDLHRLIGFYDFYEGCGQDWEITDGLDYEPTKKRSNIVKRLINEQARFLFGKPPEITVFSEDEEKAACLQCFVDGMLDKNRFAEKLLKAAKDCFIGKRIALKVGISDDGQIIFGFVPSLSFIFETDGDDTERLVKIIFFHTQHDSDEKSKQRVWRQKYELIDGKCFVWEGIYDGYGELIEEKSNALDTGLNFIPAKVIVNDGLTGDLFGESDVEGLMEMQNVYNRLSSDDVDALRFNMFPQTVVIDGMAESISQMVIAPGALMDLQTEVTAAEGRQAGISKLESNFSYDDRLEHTLNRIKSEMYEMLNVPLVSIQELKGYMTSGKSLKALYWQLVTRCEEKFVTWRCALTWLIESALVIGRQNRLFDIDVPQDLKIFVDNIFPLMEDEYEEKTLDLELVKANLMSRKTFIYKWNKGREADFSENELTQIESERG